MARQTAQQKRAAAAALAKAAALPSPSPPPQSESPEPDAHPDIDEPVTDLPVPKNAISVDNSPARKDVQKSAETLTTAGSTEATTALSSEVKSAVENTLADWLKDPQAISALDNALRMARAAQAESAPPSIPELKVVPDKRATELTALVHNICNKLLRKRHVSSPHWPTLPVFADEMGTMRYWPRGSATHSGLVYVTIEQVKSENATWDTAHRTKGDVVWSRPFAVADIEERTARPRSNDSDNGSISDDNEQEENRMVGMVHVYRPDFPTTQAASSQAFRLAVGSEVAAIVESDVNVQHINPSAVEIVHAVRTYWDTAAKEYKNQLYADRRTLRRFSKRRDRRKMRQRRALDGREDWFDKSPLSGITNEDRLRLALADKYSFVPEYLSDDEEDRFIKNEELDERELYYRQEFSNRVSYNQSAAWEAREAFWLTAELRLASVTLDDYVHKKTASGAKAVFRTPVQANQKDWSNPRWPAIRERDPTTGAPKPDGVGSVIYRFMVNHAKLRHLPGYQKFSDNLYPDPCEPAQTSGNNIGLGLAKPSLQTRCAEDQYAGMNLWETACRRYNAMTTPRDRESALVEKYRQMIEERAGIRADFGEEEISFSG